MIFMIGGGVFEIFIFLRINDFNIPKYESIFILNTKKNVELSIIRE